MENKYESEGQDDVNFTSMTGFPQKYAREVSLAIYDFEKERNEFAIGFRQWRKKIAMDYTNGTIRGNPERTHAFNILEMDDESLLKEYIKSLNPSK